MTEKPPIMKGKRLPLGYPLTPHPPTAKHHHVPGNITGPQAKAPGVDAIPLGGKNLKLGKDSKPPQKPPVDYSKPFDPPKGARS